MQPRRHLYLKGCRYSVCLTLNSINNRHKTNNFSFFKSLSGNNNTFSFFFFFLCSCVCMCPCPGNAKLRVMSHTITLWGQAGPPLLTLANSYSQESASQVSEAPQMSKKCSLMSVKITQWGLWSCYFVVGGCVCAHAQEQTWLPKSHEFIINLQVRKWDNDPMPWPQGRNNLGVGSTYRYQD